MACILDPIEFSGKCEFGTGGIKRIFMSNAFEKITPTKVKIQNDKVVSLIFGVNWFELPIDRFDASYTEKFNTKNGDYDCLLTFSINKQISEDRLAADNLNRGTWVFLFEDYNGNWWLTGLNGMRLDNSEFKTETRGGENQYQFSFTGTQYLPAYSVTEEYINNLPECSDSYTELALTSTYKLPVFWDCIVGDHPDFIP